jgi:uncharacterized membrane protein HdeD (DUF308 family)
MPAMRSAPWWLFLVTGIIWMIIGLIVLRFNLTSVTSIAVLAGCVVLVAAAAEAVNTFTAPGWQWLHGLLAVLFLILSIVIFANPGRSFVWLAAFIGWFLLFKGFADIVLSFLTEAENEAWWLLLIVGILEVLLGFWAAGRFERSAYLLIVYVGAIAIFHAVTDIVMAFRIRRLTHDLP